MITRQFDSRLDKLIKPNKVLVVYGPRRVGKTTLIDKYLTHYQGRVYRSTGENSVLRRIIDSSDFSQIIPFFSSYDLIFIDEAQQISQIGQGLKIIVDQIPHIKVIATGSSSFDLVSQVGEPLVGRQTILHLYPPAICELIDSYGGAYPLEQQANLLIYGSYPEVINAKSFIAKKTILAEIRDSYLYKDILALDNIKKSAKIEDLLRLIAYQVGSEVSHNELGTQLGLSKNTVARYLDLLEKSFVLFRLPPYYLNARKAISQKSKYYFYDNGIRNAVIDNFAPLSARQDVGALWENFLIVERLKKQSYTSLSANNFFWRTHDQQEVDWVEERGGRLHGFEFKWHPKALAKNKNKLAWQTNYPTHATFTTINRTNYLDFIT